MNETSPTTEQPLFERILAFIRRGVDADPAGFDAMALEVFAHQYEKNQPYRTFCDASGIRPDRVASWQEITAYPTDAFKHELVASFPVNDAVQAIMTSGTTAPNQRGRIFRDVQGQELVYAANRTMTEAYLFPDFATGQRCRILIMAPSLEIAPTMGMAVGLDQVRRNFGTDDSIFLVGRTGLDVRALIGALREAEESGVPVAIIGATSAFVYFFQACRKKRLRFRLPPGSRVCDGGGYRGRFGTVTRDDYYGLVEEILGVPEHFCVNTLGLGETATNYFDDSLRNHVLGRPRKPRSKVPPPWTRTGVVNCETGLLVEPGEVGLLRHHDVANLPTVLGVQSDNLGVRYAHGGFEIVGRAKVVDGKVSVLPSERSVGPMGDKRIFRLLEAYVNFSIDFKMGRVESGDEKADYIDLRREQELRRGGEGEEPSPSCPIVVEDLVAGRDDPAARRRAERALAG
jgi:hypothetical protein